MRLKSLVITNLILLQIVVVRGSELLKTKYFSLKLDKGCVVEMKSNLDGKDYSSKEQSSPLLQVRLFSDPANGIKNYSPTGMKWLVPAKLLQLDFADIAVTVVVKVSVKPSHIKFETVKVTPAKKVELVLWGPFQVTINRTVGETVGVVYDKKYAIGIQGLNVKTLGGYPESANSLDTTRICGVEDKNEYDNIYEKVIQGHRMWGNTAWRTQNGAVLQAFTRDRTKQRYMDMWGVKGLTRDIIKDGGVIGSKIALFGCPRGMILKSIGDIEIAEGLPHPMLDGKWIKLNPDGISTNLAVPFSVHNIDDYIAWAKMCPTVKTIYFSTPGPISDWGHFQHFRKWAFPNGVEDYQKTVDKIKNAGFKLGTHTLSNFITFSDSYVTKVDPRLKIIGHFELAENITSDASEIKIKDPSKDLFSQRRDWSGKKWKNVILLDKEFIAYDHIDGKGPYKLIACVRGYFGTKRAVHKKGIKSGQLYTEPGYKITHGDGAVNMEVAENLAKYTNKYGVEMISLDGLEGNWSEGHGEYSRTRFAKRWFDSLTPELQNRCIISASNAGHFLWHYISRFEWGDESLAIRCGNTKYRNMNQSFYERNFLPKFMGGYKITPTTTLDDVEWFCASAAGYNAGYALEVVNPKEMIKNPENKLICEAMYQWELARKAKAFPQVLKKYLQHPFAEFHLEALGNGKWKLYPRPDYHNRKKLGKPIIIPVEKPLDSKTIARFAPPIEKLPYVKGTTEGWGNMSQNIVDGDIRTTSKWGGAYPQTATIVLDNVIYITKLLIITNYTNPKSIYQYIVQVSKDGKNWETVSDMSKNMKPVTKDGDEIVFDKPLKVKYIKINMLHHNLNNRVEIIEVEWF
jgi:hypothetical protein